MDAFSNQKPNQGAPLLGRVSLQALSVLKMGYIWRVGDGSQIDIWNDSWIPGSPNLKIQTLRGCNLVTTVDELINPIDDTWDEDLLRSIFWPIDVQNILQIPLFPGREDLVAWHFNRSGLSSVRSAYHCEKIWENL